MSRKNLLGAGSRARSTSQSRGAVIAGNDFSALSGSIDLSNQNKAGQSSSAKPLFNAGAEAGARNTAPPKPHQSLNHQDDASMRSKSQISSKSGLDARKSGISQEAEKGLFGGQDKKDPTSSALFGGTPATKSGLFGKPPLPDLARESPAFG